jgi:hypothetical protein
MYAHHQAGLERILRGRELQTLKGSEVRSQRFYRQSELHTA